MTEKNITTVKQPLPLPEGVSNYAVGAAPVSYAKIYQIQHESCGKR